jgi:hypothetical protein
MNHAELAHVHEDVRVAAADHDRRAPGVAPVERGTVERECVVWTACIAAAWITFLLRIVFV